MYKIWKNQNNTHQLKYHFIITLIFTLITLKCVVFLIHNHEKFKVTFKHLQLLPLGEDEEPEEWKLNFDVNFKKSIQIWLHFLAKHFYFLISLFFTEFWAMWIEFERKCWLKTHYIIYSFEFCDIISYGLWGKNFII